MKKFLFGTTALAVAAMASASFAKDVELGLGGYMRAGVAFSDFAQGGVSGESDNIFHVIRDGEIHFRGKGTLDNGITITTRVELEAFTSSGDQIDENWVRVSSSFGSIMIGGNDDAAYNAGYVGFTGFGVPNFNPYDTTLQYVPVSAAAGSQFTLVGGSDRLAIHYYTPTIAGFSAGISYAPDTSSDGGADGQSTGGDNEDGELAIGASYRNSFGDFDFALGGGYFTGVEDNDRSEYGIGLEVGFSGFTLYGRYEEDTEDDQTGYTAGVSLRHWSLDVRRWLRASTDVDDGGF